MLDGWKSPKSSYKISKTVRVSLGDDRKHMRMMSTTVNSLSQLATMFSMTLFENPCDIVPLLSNRDTFVCPPRLAFTLNSALRKHSLSSSVTVLVGPVYCRVTASLSKTGRGWVHMPPEPHLHSKWHLLQQLCFGTMFASSSNEESSSFLTHSFLAIPVTENIQTASFINTSPTFCSYTIMF